MSWDALMRDFRKRLFILIFRVSVVRLLMVEGYTAGGSKDVLMGYESTLHQKSQRLSVWLFRWELKISTLLATIYLLNSIKKHDSLDHGSCHRYTTLATLIIWNANTSDTCVPSPALLTSSRIGLNDLETARCSSHRS